MGRKILAILGLFVLFSAPVMAQEAGRAVHTLPEDENPAAQASSGLPIPRFVSLASNKVFVRTGPALRYPIKWIYQRDHFPVEVIQEFDTWRKIRDIEGDTGWVHQSLLSGERMGIVKGEAKLPIRKEPQTDGKIIAYLEPNVVAAIKGCKGAWCEIMAEGYDGYAERKFLWGIYDSEDFD